MQAIAAARILVDELDLHGQITPEQVSALVGGLCEVAIRIGWWGSWTCHTAATSVALQH